MEEVLLKILPAQNYMIDKIMINSDYIFRHNQEQYRRPPKISNCQYLRYLASIISDDIIVNLYKLLKDTQHHSFQKLNAKIEYFIKQGDFEFKSKEKEEFFDAYMKDLKNLISLYNKINWEGIRNKYVGHLDRNRPAIKFELSDLKKIQIYLLSIKRNLHDVFYDVEMLEHQSHLIELIEDNIKLKASGMKSKEKLEKLKKDIEGFKNNIWAYKFEYHDLEDSHRKEVVEAFEKKIELAEAKIKAIELNNVFEEE